MIWFVFAVVTAAALIAVLHPLLRSGEAAPAAPDDRDFYRQQLAEIERDRGRGLLTEEDAETARVEAARRLLAATPATVANGVTRVSGAGRVAAALVVLAVPLFSVALYLRLGQPERPDMPLTARLSDDPAKLDINAAVSKVEAHLRKNPDDGRGYEALAPVYMKLGRPDDAAKAWLEANRILGETPDRWSAIAEAQIYAGNGVVTAEARQSIDKALAGDGENPRALYFSGVAAEQDGDKAKAVAVYEKILGSSPKDAPWLSVVRRRIAALTGQEPKAQPQAGAPSSPAAEALAALPKDQQQAAIRGMVANLATRLSENGQDVEGWLRLVRAWTVLGEGDKAKAALGDARKALAADSPALERLGALARELGLEG
ncbi:MAG: c-type cytochrome biogenesis protein CcmI [Rhizobiales bacterium]|nr:c-type cytochrome biogenesis protein CcmI [Hyphomicrobiales bacterium]